ncbi:hypothetical protein Nepgr_015216 [Nepenthes gracilis]|uniref:Uncharacterized protein n=1 Tax=Nepenthes gracilis TaxID=150966 RepID=A0AAD3SME7_NEPGR|nr:hypothetical protein Nepgr_015216 [Nepenthes gracilis]
MGSFFFSAFLFFLFWGRGFLFTLEFLYLNFLLILIVISYSLLFGGKIMRVGKFLVVKMLEIFHRKNKFTRLKVLVCGDFHISYEVESATCLGLMEGVGGDASSAGNLSAVEASTITN